MHRPPFCPEQNAYSSFGQLGAANENLPTAAAGIFPLISVAIELNLACLIYLIKFFSRFFIFLAAALTGECQ